MATAPIAWYTEQQHTRSTRSRGVPTPMAKKKRKRSKSGPPARLAAEPADAGVWQRVLTVAWCSILLGLAIEVVLIAVAAGYDTLQGPKPVIADTVQKVSWAFLVCVGLASGTVAAKIRPLTMGVLGMISGPVALFASRALHKGMSQALSISSAASGPSPLLLASIKGVEYAFLGATLGWLSSRDRVSLKSYLALGALAGALFGGTILWLMITAAQPPLNTPAILSRAVNELVFPIGCSFVLFVAHALSKRLAAKDDSVDDPSVDELSSAPEPEAAVRAESGDK